jgi:hypothetical protein
MAKAFAQPGELVGQGGGLEALLIVLLLLSQDQLSGTSRPITLGLFCDPNWRETHPMQSPIEMTLRISAIKGSQRPILKRNGCPDLWMQTKDPCLEKYP